MSIHYKARDNHLWIHGHTYPVRDKIRALGGMFDGSQKAWRLFDSPENRAKLEQFCRPSARVDLNTSVISDENAGLILDDSVQEKTVASETNSVPLNQNPDALTVREVVARAHSAISRAFSDPVWIVGEIQNLNHRGAHVYFALSEAKSVLTQQGTICINATIWSSVWQRLKKEKQIHEILAEGIQVRLRCEVSLYKDRASLSLNIIDIDPQFTKGALALAREQLLREMRQKGLDQQNKKRFLPRFPMRIGLITADPSRALSDFLHQLESLKFPGQVVLYSARMQGENVSREVLMGIKALEEYQCDMIVVTRGGGSSADLRWFDGRELALAVAECSLPIVAAIGHHDDVCVVEEMCFRREKTPTAAADFVANHFRSSIDRLYDLSFELQKALNQQSANCELRIRRYKESLDSEAQRILARLSQASLVLSHQIASASQNALALCAQNLAELFQKIQARDPSPWIQQGWTRLTGENGDIISAIQVKIGQELKARLIDGSLELTVKKIQAKQNEH